MEQQGFFDEIWKLFRETDRRMQETDRFLEKRFGETDRKLKEVGRQIGGLGGRLGDFVEWMVRPGLVRVFKERGIAVHQTLRDIELERDGEAAQIDLLVVNDTDAVVVEVKSKLDPRDVEEHLERIAKFKRLMPRYADARLLGAIAAVVLPSDAARHAERHGLFVIGQRGEDVAILNSPEFVPREW
jgi:hypothetical protein